MPNEPTEASSGGRTRLVPVSRFGRLLLVGAVIVAIAASLTAAVAAGSHPRTGTVTGIVVYGPMLPADPGAGVSWPPQKAVVSVFKRGETAPLLTHRTAADGRFAIHLARGRYRLSAQPAGVSTRPISHDVTVTLAAGDTRHVRIWLDTGVRFPPARLHGADARPDELPVFVFKSQSSLATSATHAHLSISRECCIEHSNPHVTEGSTLDRH